MAMKILLVIILLVVIIETFCAVFHQHNSVVEVKEEPGPGGLWQTKTRWKAHWVKHWEMRKIWIPIWRKVWGPVELKEWIPFPKPTPTRASTWALPPR